MPEQHVDDDPVTVFAAALAASQYLKGYAYVYVGADNRSRVTAPARVVIYPVGGPLVVRGKGDSIIDINLDVRLDLWARSMPLLWSLNRRVAQAIKEHMVAAGYFVEWKRADFDGDSDTSEQGEQCSITVALRNLPFLPADLEYGLVDDVVYDQTLSH